MNIPRITINQTFSKTSIDTQSAKVDLKLRQADLEIKQKNVTAEINQTRPSVSINQSRAFDALGQGSVFEVTDTILDNMIQTGLNAIKSIASKGETFQDIHLYDNNLISEFAKTDKVDFSAYKYAGRASCANVDVNIESGKLEMDWSEGKVEVDAYPNKTLLDYTSWKVDVYLSQKNSVEIIPPQIDLTI